ncbi:hypothetical protein F4678DRAFT_298206 [Xylaria arbuscula]|nr:hypothetical protein F4678DRAFT_298206 [Xylaria arbuscula]
MAHGFEKLEQLFTGSRRRRRDKQRSIQQQQNATILTNRRTTSPMFPSPSYLRPTSMHMTPRDAHIDGPEGDMSRSLSVPTLQEALNKRSSVASSVTIINRSSRSDHSISSPQRSNKNSPTKPRSSRFRFPEDSLFRNHQPIGSATDSTKNDALQGQSSPTPDTDTALLDWTPTHISLLFNPLEFKSSPSGLPWGPEVKNTESTLLPSPDFAPLRSSPDSDKSSDKTDQKTIPDPPLLSPTSEHKLTLNPRQQSLSAEKPLINRLPLLGTGEASQKPSINRSMSLNGLMPSRPSTARAILMRLSQSDNMNNLKGAHSTRETWGNRVGDPKFRSAFKTNREGIPRSMLRRPASTSTLSISTWKISKCGTLKEPTFNDFYALSDDDIAESQPPTRDERVPPTPPRKRIRNSCTKDRLSQTPASRQAAFKPVQEEITPPSTPTNYHLLTLTYSPANARDTLGALRAAQLARKYDFNVLYVLSLWPVDGGRRSDSTVTVLSPTNETAMERFGAPTKTTQVSGRLLAAYGLNEVPSPFEIVTDTHVAALNCDYWNEYRNVDARPDDISRGWICPFYSEYTPAFGQPRATGGLDNHPKNRGIVFAAYSKQTFNPIIPMRTSAKQALLLRQLYTDAKALIETLIEPAFESRKTPASRQHIRNSVIRVQI